MKKQHPMFRGYFAARNTRTESTYVDMGSLKVLSMAGPDQKCWAFSVFFTYATTAPTDVVFKNGREQVTFRKIFISQSFPFLRFSPHAKGVYKSLHFFMGRLGVQSKNEVVIQTGEHGASEYKVLGIEKILPDAGISEASAIFSKINELAENLNALDHQYFALLDQSLKVLERRHPSSEILGHIRQYRILLCAAFQVNHRDAFKTLEQWTSSEKNSGRDAAANDLIARVAKITHPLALGRHGYYASFADLDLKLVAQELHAVMQKVAALGVVPFLNSGTLLGYVRQGKPLPHDDDFDLGIWLAGQTEREIFENWRHFVKALRLEFAVITKGNFVSVRMENGVQIDMFPAWTLAGKTYIYPYCFADCDEGVLQPFKTMRIEGLDFTVPAQPENLLSVNYGPSWRAPDPYWRFDFNKAQSRFKCVMKLMKVTH